MTEQAAPLAVVSVTSRLSDARDHNRFLALSARLRAWLEQQPGFLRYELYSGGNGSYLDTMLWSSWDAAQQGNARFAETDLRAEFAELVSDYAPFAGVQEQLD